MDTRSIDTFGLGFVPAPELPKSAFFIKRNEHGSRNALWSKDKAQKSIEWELRTSQIHRKWLGLLALLEYKVGGELGWMSIELSVSMLERKLPIPSCAAVASGRL